jgi:hypothetical protein
MATKGILRVVGCNQRGQWIVEPSPAAVDVLSRAMAKGDEIEVRQVVPTRGRRRKAKDHTLRLAK